MMVWKGDSGKKYGNFWYQFVRFLGCIHLCTRLPLMKQKFYIFHQPPPFEVIFCQEVIL